MIPPFVSKWILYHFKESKLVDGVKNLLSPSRALIALVIVVHIVSFVYVSSHARNSLLIESMLLIFFNFAYWILPVMSGVSVWPIRMLYTFGQKYLWVVLITNATFCLIISSSNCTNRLVSACLTVCLLLRYYCQLYGVARVVDLCCLCF